MNTTTPHPRALVICDAGGEGFALDVAAVERVVRHAVPRRVPNSAAWLVGVLTIDGRVVPILALRERLGLPAAEAGEHARIVVVALESGPLGLVVDRVHEVAAVEPGAVEDAPPVYRGLTREYVQGLLRRGDRLHVLLDVERLVTSTERLAMRAALEEDARDG